MKEEITPVDVHETSVVSETEPTTPSAVRPSRPIPTWVFIVGLLGIAVLAYGAGRHLAPVSPTVISTSTDTPATETPDTVDTSTESPVDGDVFHLTNDMLVWETPGEQPVVDVPAALRVQIQTHQDQLLQQDEAEWSEALGGSDALFRAYRFARVTSGPYAGYDLLRVEYLAGVGLADYYTSLLVLQKGDDAIVLTSDDVSSYPGLTASEHVAFARVRVDALVDVPEQVVIDGVTFRVYARGASYTWGSGDSVWNPDLIQQLQRGVSTVNGVSLAPLKMVSVGADVLYSDLPYFPLPNGDVVWYRQQLPFMPEDVSPGAPGVPAISWNDGSQNTDAYIEGKQGGCGLSSPVFVAGEEEVVALAPAGTVLVQGEAQTIYAATRVPASDAYAFDWWKQYGVGADMPADQQTIEAFLATRPFIYWKDVFGRFVRLTSASAVPAAECGKPVIYLYPEQTTDVSVQLDPQGGFTKTEPAYGEGWQVTAQPDGTLTNHADGMTYPYLFWEGRGGMYQSPESYWVIAQADVSAFISSTLTTMGLNAREIADFSEFWLPRMQNAPYYKIGFHGTRVMDVLAPLSVTPTPDAVLRVLMDYEELDAPIEAHPPTVPPSFIRTGFTVVEWGGVLR